MLMTELANVLSNRGFNKYNGKLFPGINTTTNGLDISLFQWVMKLFFIIMHINHASIHKDLNDNHVTVMMS